MSIPPDPIIEASELKDASGAPKHRVLEATWIPGFAGRGETGRDLFNAMHILGAQFFDIDEVADGSSSLPHMLPSQEAFAAHVSALGIKNDEHIVIYDQNNLFAAARVWWMFRVMGHENIQVLNGGLSAWITAQGYFECQQTPTQASAYAAQLIPTLLTAGLDLSASFSSALILDARPGGRFEGTVPEPRPDLRSGHIPGSKNLPSGVLLDDAGKLRSADELGQIFGDTDVDPATPGIVTTCGSGVSAAIISLALARLGNWNARLYDGSWAEWGASDWPVETV